jgi:cytochrome P450
MLQDPITFPSPETFNPERYAGDDSAMDQVTDVLFGFGRRVCPGKFLAIGSLYAIIPIILATCDIRA